ncbi:phage head closure protein [Dokdonella sp. MW10]|uniref:phage head closure protein n=1 Tax=Dokdonella sp. MW10 TaxID=2992926 RepID=UPI003F7CFCE6
MLTQRLRHRVDIEMPARVQDASGSLTDTWASYARRVPADVVPLSGREFIAAQAEQAGVTTRITIRLDAGVIPNMRIRHLGVVHNILAVLPDPSFRRHMTLMCEAGVPAPAIEYAPPPTGGALTFNGDQLAFNGEGVTFNGN